MNHRTAHRRIPIELASALLAESADIVVLTEYVVGPGRPGLESALLAAGLKHQHVSRSAPAGPGRWSNQVFVCARTPLEQIGGLSDPPDIAAGTNHLGVLWNGFRVLALRAPMYKLTRDWYQYWKWLTDRSTGWDIIVGDLNADPERNRPRDRVLTSLQDRSGLCLRPGSGWSYRGPTGSESKLDHVLTRPDLSARATYESWPVDNGWSDHAALRVELLSE